MVVDDQVFLNSINEEWYEILIAFDWLPYRPHAADYYNALYEFNQKESLKNDSSDVTETEVMHETQDEAK